MLTRISSLLKTLTASQFPRTSRKQSRRRQLAIENLETRVLLAAIGTGNLVVYRVGDGAGGLVNTGNAVFIDEYTPSGTLVQSIAMPTTSSGSNKQLIASGTATSEGMLTVSPNGQFVTVTGYARDIGGVGSLSGTTSAAVNRSVGIITVSSGAVDSSTALTNWTSGNNPRSAATTNGTDIWLAGGTNGVSHTNKGATTATTGLTTLGNVRQVNVFNNQLYASNDSTSGNTVILGTVGSGLPTTGVQTYTSLPGFITHASTPSASAYSFFFADLSTSVAGLDTLYVADDSALALTKYSLVSGNWTANGTVGVDADDYRGITGAVSGSTVTLFATRKGGSGATGGGELVSLADSSGHNGAFSGAPTLLATAAANTAFRGVGHIPLSADTTPPAVSTLAPADNATNVPVGSNLVATFSENVAIGTGNILVKRTSDDGVVFNIPLADAAVSVLNNVVTINPSSDLLNNIGYYVEIPNTAFKDASNNFYGGTVDKTTWNFTTAAAADLIAPTVTALSPADNAANVAVGSNLVVTFDETIAAGTGNILVRRTSDDSTALTIPVSDSQVTVSGAVLTINPSSDLDNSTGYYIQIASTAVVDSAGNAYAGINDATTWNFSTAAPPDVTPPTVVSIVDDRSGAAINANLPVVYTITFSEDINLSTIAAIDFDNAGTASITIGTIAEPNPGVVTVVVTPTSTGTLQLRIPTGAIISDTSGNDLVPPVVDDTTITINAVTTLTAGDIAFTGIQSDDPDTFSFVLLKDVVNGTQIRFTDNRWDDGTSTLATNETTMTVTFVSTGTGFSAGTHFVNVNGGTAPAFRVVGTSTSGGTRSGAISGLSTSGDSLLAYQGSAPSDGASSAWIAGINTRSWNNGATGNNQSALPTALTLGTNAIQLSASATKIDNGAYQFATFIGSVSEIRAVVNNILNWTTNDAIGPVSGTTFNIVTTSTDLFINEVVFNPVAATDTGEEYIELRGTPNTYLPGTAYLLLLDGDSEDTAGNVDHRFYLGGMQFGSNGYLVLRQFGSTYAVDPNSALVTATSAGWGATWSSRSTDIENGSVSVLLIQLSAVPAIDVDVDTDDDGNLNSGLGWTIRDAIGNIDGGASDTGYGLLNTTGNGNGLVPAGSSLSNLSGYHPDYMARNGSSTGYALLTNTSTDWVVGELAGAMPNATLATGGFTRPAAYEGAALNHLGALNSFSAANGPPVAVDDNLSDIAEDSGNRSISIASLITNDSDPNGDTLSITAVTNAVGGTVSISGANVIFSPTLNFNGAASFEYTLSDGSLTDIGLVTFTITAVNDAPTAGTIPNITVRQGAADSNLDLKSVFSDLETSDALLVYSVSGNTNSALFTSVTISLGTLTLDYNAVVFGSSVITVRATDEGSSFVEASFTVTVNYTLQLLHLADAEAGLLASTTAPNLAALVDAFDDDFSQTLILAGGDNWIPGPFLAGGTDAAVRTVLNQVSGSTITGTIPIAAVDIAIHNELGVEVSAIGNHEFDLGSRVFRDSFTPGGGWVGANFVHVSANLNFSGDAELSSRFTNTLDGGTGTLIPEASSLKGRIAPSVVVTKGGEKIGIVGATTQLIESISSPSGTEVAGFPGGPGPNGETDNMDLLAAQLQPVIDELRAEGINKIILMSHLQLISNEQSLATKLNGVDIILSAGSNTRLGDSDDVAVVFPGHAANFANNYPLITAGTDGKTTVIINTDNEFTYLGRLVVEFDAAGDINVTGLADLTSINGAYAATTTNVAAAWAADGGLSAAFAEGTKGEEVADLTEAVAAVITAKDGNISGFTDVYLQGERATVRNQETNLGNLTADANAAALVNALGSAAPSTFVASLKNGGGIRAQIGTVSAPDPLTGEVSFLPPAANSAAGKPAGAVSQLDIENSLRFNNSLMAFDTTAAGLKAILEHGVALLGNQGRFPQIGGVRFSFDPSAAAGSRVRNIVLIDENDVVIAAIVKNGVVSSVAPTSITIVTLSFLANGGDGYPIKANGDNFRFLLTDGTLSAPINESLDFGSAANIPANILGEQTALFDYVRAAFPGPGSAYNQADTPITADTRIQNLSQRSDGVFPANSSPTNINLTTSSLAENAGANSVVGSFSAVDPNVDDTFTFSLPAGLNSNSLFNISGTSLRATGSFDFEAGASYTITARVTDSGGLTFDKQFTITITDVNEATFDGNIFYNTNAAAEKNFSPDQTGQRSMIRNVQAVFNGDVAIPAGPVTNSSFVLSRLGGSPMSIGLTVVSRIFSGGKTTVLLGFTSGTHSVSGSLNDGNYRLVIDYGVLGIDGDGNGQVGGLRTINFHRFFGDSDGDRDVDARDSANYRTGLRGNASWLALFDFDNDGVLLTGGLQDQQDKDAFFANFGRLLNSSL